MADKGTIIVVESSDIVARGISTILKSGGYGVYTALSGEAGQALIERYHESSVLVMIGLGLTKGIDTRPVVEAARKYKIPFVYLALMDFVLDQDAKTSKILGFVRKKAKKKAKEKK